MSFLLDTCFVSELQKPSPDQGVLEWSASCDDDDMYLCAVTLGELKYGIDRLGDGQRRSDFLLWFAELQGSFGQSTLSVTETVCIRWGELRARLAANGIQLSVLDGLIAACALEHGMAVVTRNEGDFRPTGVQVINPWRDPPGSVRVQPVASRQP